MSIQTIIDKAAAIEIDRRRIVSQSISRSQRIKTAERAAAQPLQFVVTPPAYLKYSTNRGTIEAIQAIDRSEEVQINLANNPKMSYLTKYQGGLITTSTLAALTITNFTGTTVTIGGFTTATSVGTVLFASGDFIQPANSRYPYIVTNTVVKIDNFLTTYNVTVHRSLITSEGINPNGQSLKVGNSCTMQVVVNLLPTYRIVPYDLVEFKDSFVLIEKII
jgi:hypothetical protein